MNEETVWDGLAGRYETVVALFDTSYGRVRERLADDLAGGGRVLEIAAGTGQFTPDLARYADDLLATDVAPQMVERLRERVAEEGLEHVRCAVMSAYEIDEPDSSFDAVFCANALHVMEEPKRALAEFYRVLREGGVLIAPTFLHGTGVLRRGLSRTLSLVSPFVAHTRFDLVSLRHAVENAGFTVVHSETMPGLFPLGYIVARR